MNINTKKTIDKIFDDLTRYREFCVTYGHFYDEADLYNMRNYSFRQFQNHEAGKSVKSQWDIDEEKFLEEQARKARFQKN